MDPPDILRNLREVVTAQGDAALVRLAVRARGDQSWVLSSSIRFDKPSAKPPALRHYAYPELVLTEQWLEGDEALDFLMHIVVSQETKFPLLGLVCSPSYSPNIKRLSSGRVYYHRPLEWPSIVLECSASLSQEEQQLLQRPDPLTGPQVPLYPSARSAILSFLLDFHTHHDTSMSVPSLLALASDRRGRIERIQLHGDTFTVVVGRDRPVPCTIKLYGPAVPGSCLEDGVQIDEKSQASVQFNGKLDFLFAGLVTAEGELLDDRMVDLRWPWSQSGVEIVPETREIQVLQWIETWETDQIEFKPALKKDDYDDFLETVVAFANTHGGVIILGVTKKRDPIGFYRPDFEDFVADLVSGRCYPVPVCKVEVVTVGGKQLTVVHVEKLSNHPLKACALDRTKIYIRSHGTDRIAPLEELIRIFGQTGEAR